LKLYVVAGSPNSRKVLAVVHHLGKRLGIEWLDFRVGAHKAADYLAVNPNGLVPSLVNGDLKLWESHAIMQYLCDTSPPSSLFPLEPAARADVVRWLCWQLAHFGNHLGTAMLERLFKPLMGATPDDAVARGALARLAPLLDILERQLAPRPFVAGSEVTLADYSLASQLTEAHRFGVLDLTPQPSVRRWLERVEALPEWQATAMPQPMVAAIEAAVRSSR
jgi:glutathione S-transferase